MVLLFHILDDESHTSANLDNVHGFILKNILFIEVSRFGKTQNKAMKAYTECGHYHTIVESRVDVMKGVISKINGVCLELNHSHLILKTLFCRKQKQKRKKRYMHGENGKGY